MQVQTKKDAELIKAYAETGDEGAFAEIVSRYGAMVYSVCFRKLVNSHDAKDASQAVFMALVKKSSHLKEKKTLACWLYAVARQTALFMARSRVRRDKREIAAAEIMNAESHSYVGFHDSETILGILDEELSALSAGQREAVILRHLQGLSEKDASEVAECAPGTLSKRAFDGILTLRKRLANRGCALGIPALIGVLATESQAAVPETLIPSLLAVPKLAAAGAAAGTASANIIFLMEGALKTMAIAKIKTAGIGILIALLIGTTGVMAVKEIQKKQAQGASEKPDIVASPKKQEVLDQSKSPKLETKDKTQSAKITQPPKARNFQAEMEEALARLPEGKHSPELDKIMREWFDYDKDGAIEWVMKFPEGHARYMAILKVAAVWSMKDPVAASEWAMTLPEGQARSIALSAVALAWAQKDPVAASEWAMKLPEGNARHGALASVAVSWARQDPVAAYDLAMKLPDDPARDYALGEVARLWASKDPVAASDLVMKLPEGKYKDKLLSDVVAQWVTREPDNAKNWIEKSSLSQDEKDKLLKKIEKK